MLAPIWLRAAHRGVPIFLVTALLLGQSPMALAESPAQRQELVAALRQLDALERTVADSAARAPIQPGERYHFDYPRLLADLARVRAGIQAVSKGQTEASYALGLRPWRSAIWFVGFLATITMLIAALI